MSWEFSLTALPLSNPKAREVQKPPPFQANLLVCPVLLIQLGAIPTIHPEAFQLRLRASSLHGFTTSANTCLRFRSLSVVCDGVSPNCRLRAVSLGSFTAPA